MRVLQGFVNASVLVGVACWLAGSGTQRERPVFEPARAGTLAALERAAAEAPVDVARTERLAQGYLDAHASGAAVRAVEDAPAETFRDPRVQHVYARALVEQGRAADALKAEQRALAACETSACSSHLVASATRRSDILGALVELGVEDAEAAPEETAVAYVSATREVRLAVR